jgi:hypothetical protein
MHASSMVSSTTQLRHDTWTELDLTKEQHSHLPICVMINQACYVASVQGTATGLVHTLAA